MRQRLQATATAKKHVILFLAANPRDTGLLALDREARTIHLELKYSGHRDRFDFVTRWAVESSDLLRDLHDLKPSIVHFSGHGIRPVATGDRAERRDADAGTTPSGGGPAGALFASANGGGKVVTPEAFARALDGVGSSVRLVVLNACYTASLASALLEHVDCVVGMSGAIHDDAARNFAIGFYGGLGERESIAAAYAQGTAAINLSGLPDADQPQLKVREGIDPSALILASVEPALLVKLPCPYPGMRPYQADDAEGFYGRNAEVEELIGRLRAGEREIYVIGPSGSGKSSLVAAGLLPPLARGVSGLGPFVVRTVRPGERPAARLAEALDAPGQPLMAVDRVAALLGHRGPNSSVLLVVDQLEELFTLASADERHAFLAALHALRSVPRCVVICTLRADFFGALIESSLWPEHRDRKQLSHIEVSPLRGEALREAIAAPAHEIGVEVEPELVERLLADAASEPGILPLLQETLVQLWDKRTEQVLTLAHYLALGDGERSGLAVALARRADATLRRFTVAQADIARRILLRLISFGEGRSDTRRQQPRAELCAGEDAVEFARVLQTMVDDRLLTVDEDVAGEPRVDLAHEIMISAWPTLAGWIRRHRVDEQRRRHFEEAAVQHGRGVRGLLDPIELAEAENWQRTESAVQLGRSAQVMALIAASRAAQTKQRRRRRALGGTVGLLGLVVVAVTAAALAARDQANEAREQRLRAEASDRKNRDLVAKSYAESGRQLLVARRFQEAVPYLVAARKNGDDRPPLRMMFWEAKRHLPAIPALEHQAAVRSAAFSPDGTRVITASGDGTARVWDAATGKPLTSPFRHNDVGFNVVFGAAFSPDGSRVVTAAGKPNPNVLGASGDGTAWVWDAATGKPLTSPLEQQGQVWSAAFSPDGTRVVTASYDKTARVWDVPLDTETLPQWLAIAERSPFALNKQGVLMLQSELPSASP
jgi:hypothetical protein